MDKTNAVNTFTELVDQLRNTECSQKEKISCFQRIAECIVSPAVSSHLNYATFCSKATNVLLLFCEDLDSVVRISAEENLNKIFRVLEKSRVSRILMDLYGEIKRNGNQRSLRICLKIFSYYAPQIREQHLRWYAQHLLPCLQVIAKRKETLLQETLAEFVLKFGNYVQPGLTDSETCKLFESFISNIGSECAVKRRCSAHNCTVLIVHSLNKALMAKYALNKMKEILQTHQETNSIIGSLGFLRQLLPIVIKGLPCDGNDYEESYPFNKSSRSIYAEECIQILEIYDYCLYLVYSSPNTKHSIINAALEVLNSILQCLEGISSGDAKNRPRLASCLLHLLTDKNLKHNDFLKSKATLKHQIFNVTDFEDSEEDNTATPLSDVMQQLPQQSKATITASAKSSLIAGSKRYAARSISECVDIDYVEDEEHQQSQYQQNIIADDEDDDDDDDDDDFTTLSATNESSSLCLANIKVATTKTITTSSMQQQQQHKTNVAISGIKLEGVNAAAGGGNIQKHTQHLLVNFSSDDDAEADEKSNQLCNTDNESVNSIDFKQEISRGLVVDGAQITSDFHTAQHDGGGGGIGGSSPSKSIAPKLNLEKGSVPTATQTKSNTSDAFSSFFNNINAASESVTKLFRQSSTTKNVTVTAAATSSSNTTTDTISLTSDESDAKRLESDIEVIDETPSPDTSKTIPTPSTAILGDIQSIASSSSDRLSSMSMAVSKDIDSKNQQKPSPKHNPFNPSPPKENMSESDPPQLPVNIGSMYEQPLIYYTGRLITGRFLLNGRYKGIYDEVNIRVSIKSVCLNVISQCCRIAPDMLQISLKYIQEEKPKIKRESEKSNHVLTPHQANSETSSNVGQDFDYISTTAASQSSSDFTDFVRKSSFNQLDLFNRLDDETMEAPLLDIKEDYFGESSTDYNFTSPSSAMSKSVDPVMLRTAEDDIANDLKKLNIKKDKLATSEIVASNRLKDYVEITYAKEDMPPEMSPPRPPKRMKSMRKSKLMQDIKTPEAVKDDQSNDVQLLYDVLYYYDHDDPILRAGVQNIIGNFIRSTQAGLVMNLTINLQFLLAILCKGLQDEIHTVVIQALNTFDKIFPYMLTKYMTTSSVNEQQPMCCCSCVCRKSKGNVSDATSRIQTTLESSTPATAKDKSYSKEKTRNAKNIFQNFIDNDDIINELLNAFQLQRRINKTNDDCNVSKIKNTNITALKDKKMDSGKTILCLNCKSLCCCSTQSSASTTELLYCCCCINMLYISPKLLLNKLRLCHSNKYWLVQNKYAEVISNLNYASLRFYCGNIIYAAGNNKNFCINSSGHGSFAFGNAFEEDIDATNFVSSLENSFMDELLQLIGDDDVRVREYSAKCLCNFIIQNAKDINEVIPSISSSSLRLSMNDENASIYSNKKVKHEMELHEQEMTKKNYYKNFELLTNFFNYSIFNAMPSGMRTLFQISQQQQQDMYSGAALDDTLDKSVSSLPMLSMVFNKNMPTKPRIEANLSKVLYRLTNKLMYLNEKNTQFGIIYCIKYLLKHFTFADYTSAWLEFNFMEIFVKLSQYNYNTAVDLTCQSDVIDVSSKLIAASLIFQPNVQQQRDFHMVLLKHILKIINIYYHIFTNQKPLIMAKGQKLDIFTNAKEVAQTQAIGYFGNDHIHLKLYQTLKSAYDNYKITINEEAGSKLISLLKTSLNSLSLCIELLSHEALSLSAAEAGAAPAATTGSAATGVSSGGVAKNATDINAVLFSTFANSSPSSVHSSTSSLNSTSANNKNTGGAGTQQGLANNSLVLKLIEETLYYLTKVINYAPVESIACLRQLLKYLFARNYGNRQNIRRKCNYPAFTKAYFRAKSKGLHCIIKEDACPNVQTTNLASSSSASPLGSANVTKQTSPATTTTMVTSTLQSSSKRASVVDLMIAAGGYDDAVGVAASVPMMTTTTTTTTTTSSIGLQDDCLLLAELYASGLEFHTWKSENEQELSKHIKLFEPLVIYCLTLFLKCNGRTQAAIIELLILLLDLNVTYSILDSKNVIFEHIIRSLDLIETGIARNSSYAITPMIKFLVKLSSKSERNLITIPKILSICNNLLANYNIRNIAVQALKTLAYEIFLMSPAAAAAAGNNDAANKKLIPPPSPMPSRKLLTTATTIDDPNLLGAATETETLNNELDTQKEVILGMLEKFIESIDCQQVLSLLLLIEKLQQQQIQTHSADKPLEQSSFGGAADAGLLNRVKDQQQSQQQSCLPNIDTVCGMICQSISTNRLCIKDWNDYYLVDAFFKNNSKYLLGNSKEFTALLKYLMEGDVTNFSDLSYATIILSNVILKTEEIYLVNHIKLYLKNHPAQVEKIRQRELEQHQQQQQQQRQKHETANQSVDASRWQILDTNTDDKPTTSKAAAAAAAASVNANSSNGVINEINYFATVLCEALQQCMTTLTSSSTPGDGQSYGTLYNHYFSIQYCRLVHHFMKVFYKLCFNSRLEDCFSASIRFILMQSCNESKLLNEYYNLLLMYSSVKGCLTIPTTFSLFGSSSSSSSATFSASSSASSAGSSLASAAGTGAASASSCNAAHIKNFREYQNSGADEQTRVISSLQIEIFQLLNAIGVLDPLALLQRLQSDDISNHVRRVLLEKVCHQSNPNPIEWNLQQVQHLLNGKFLNILIIEQFAFMCNLCEVDEEFCSLFQATLMENITELNKHSIVYLLRLVTYLCKKSLNCSLMCFAKFLQILNKLHKLTAGASSSSSSSVSPLVLSMALNRPLQLQIERLTKHLINDRNYDRNAIYDTFLHLLEEEEEQQEGEHAQRLQYKQYEQQTESNRQDSCRPSLSQLEFIILNDLENSYEINDDNTCRNMTPTGHGISIKSGGDGSFSSFTSTSSIVDEKWIFNQLIKFSAQNYCDPQQIVKILLEIQSENKIHKIFNDANFDAQRVLRHSIMQSLQAMLQTFRNNCIQYNPHIHYMQPNPLARVCIEQLMTRIREEMLQEQDFICNLQQQQQIEHTATVVRVPTHAMPTTATTTTTIQIQSNASGNNNIINSDPITMRTTIITPKPAFAPPTESGIMHLCEAVIALMENIKQIEVTALIYIESKFIDKFLSEHLLRPEHVITIVRFIGWCCQRVQALISSGRANPTQQQRMQITVLLKCIDILLHQKFIWNALNQQQATSYSTNTSTSNQQQQANKPMSAGTAGGASSAASPISSAPPPPLPSPPSAHHLTKCELNKIICSILDVVLLSATLLLENTLFYKKHRTALRSTAATINLNTNKQQQIYENVSLLLAIYNPRAIFLGKLIETKIGNNDRAFCSSLGNSYYSPTHSSGTCNNAAELKGINNHIDFISLDTLISIAVSTLRCNLFYALAVTPFEIILQQQRLEKIALSATTSPSSSPFKQQQQQSPASHLIQSPNSNNAGAASAISNLMLPIIPIESLSDVDILRSFVKRLSIFGFTTRQQFEEYFMTFLLLINKVYDENMVDQQEQYQIRSICLEAIMELLITYKTFPIVGNKRSLYHHTTRWERINCDTISLKKLHLIQLFISPINIFYFSNLERNLKMDNLIGTHNFTANQYDLNFIWQQMENSTSSSPNNSMDESSSPPSVGVTEAAIKSPPSLAAASSSFATKVLNKNYQNFTRESGIDYKSSSQLIFDVLMQMIESNHILILPNLVKFMEICENREQIKQIWEKADYLRTHIPMDDTISHQHLIYLLCKTKSILIPTQMEMISLENIIKGYLKSSHLFIRCAALNGLLSLMECYAKTSTTIGKLSDELQRIKEIILQYIDKHGLIEESSLQCSDIHTKLIWTLNYCLMEWTSRLDPQCNVAYHTKLTVNKILKKSTNEQIYLTILHGLERMIVLDNKVCNSFMPSGDSKQQPQHQQQQQQQQLRPNIEKLALELAKLENENFSIPALKLLLSCIYVGSSKQLENTELNNGIVQDDPEIIAQQTDKIDILLQCIKTATEEAAWIYGQVLCQIIRDLVPPKEILTKVIKEFLAINQPHCDVIAMIVFQVFRSAIDSAFLQQLQDWLTCSLPTFLSLNVEKAVWCLSVVFLSASINLHLMKLFPLLLSQRLPATKTPGTTKPTTPTTTTGPIALSSCEKYVGAVEKLGHHEIALFVTSAQDFYAKLGIEQKQRFREAFKEFHHIKVYNKMLQSL